jgi:hypothetical protein
MSSKIFDFNELHPNIQKITTVKHYDNCVKYHYKQAKPYTNISLNEKDIRILKCIKNIEIDEDELDKIDLNSYVSKTTDPKEFDVNEFIKNPPVDPTAEARAMLKESRNWTNQDTFNCETITDALLKNGNPKMAGAIIASFHYKPTNYGIEPRILWRVWQDELFQELKNQANERSIIWYVDLIGKGGKSSFAQHMMKWHGAFLGLGADTKDLPTALLKHKATGGKFNIVIIDLSRTTHEKDDFYDAIEQIKNGIVMCKKYNSLILDLECKPHVVILSNREPRRKFEAKVIIEDVDEHNMVRIVKKKELRDTLSNDRWDIRTIDKVKNFTTGKNEWKVINREYNPIYDDDDELPEGYSRPGEGNPIAEPDEINIDNEDGYSSISNPTTRKLKQEDEDEDEDEHEDDGMRNYSSIFTT